MTPKTLRRIATVLEEYAFTIWIRGRTYRTGKPWDSAADQRRYTEVKKLVEHLRHEAQS